MQVQYVRQASSNLKAGQANLSRKSSDACLLSSQRSLGRVVVSPSPSLLEWHHSPTSLSPRLQQINMVVIKCILAGLGSIMSIRTRQSFLLHQPADLVGRAMLFSDEAT